VSTTVVGASDTGPSASAAGASDPMMDPTVSVGRVRGPVRDVDPLVASFVVGATGSLDRVTEPAAKVDASAVSVPGLLFAIGARRSVVVDAVLAVGATRSTVPAVGAPSVAPALPASSAGVAVVVLVVAVDRSAVDSTSTTRVGGLLGAMAVLPGEDESAAVLVALALGAGV
jgi:hypothetical protein